MFKIVPLNLTTANKYVLENHRHHTKVRGCKFCIGIKDELEKLRGVAIASRPVSRHQDDGLTLEVTRLCTDGVKNGCAKLYSAVARIAKEMGYEQVITYTLETEGGSSLRASGWNYDGSSVGGVWSPSHRPRNKQFPLFSFTAHYPVQKKKRWVKFLNV